MTLRSRPKSSYHPSVGTERPSRRLAPVPSEDGGGDMTEASKGITKGSGSLAEMKEFASFSAATQRYVRRSLDVGLARREAMDVWSRDVGEMASIRAQDRMYDRLGELRESVPDDSGLSSIERFVAPLTLLTAFDLGQGRLTTFSAYRFLYERLLGARSRPWLPSAFCAASALPSIQPDMRRTLLHSISEAAATAAGWSTREPVFFPFWVEKVEEIPRAA
jgi:hypothetical protein